MIRIGRLVKHDLNTAIEFREFLVELIDGGDIKLVIFIDFYQLQPGFVYIQYSAFPFLQLLLKIGKKLLRLYFPFLNCLMSSEEHTSELQSLMRISYAVFCLKKK